MICDLCKKNEAIIHVQEHSPKGVKTVNICLECAATRGLKIKSEDVGKLMFNFVNNLFGNKLMSHSNPIDLNNFNLSELTDLKCSACGTTVDKISEDKKVGCPVCFSEFHKIIDLILYRLNNSLEFKGELPLVIENIRQYKIKVINLKKRLKQSIKSEDYALAASIRDEINSLRGSFRGERVRDEQNS